MTYIGQQPSTTFDSGIQDRFTGLTTNTVTLTHDISAETDILVVWNNIVQDSSTYSVGGTGNKTLTLGGTLSSGDVVTVYYTNKVMQSVNPTAGSVGLEQLSATGTASSSNFLRGDNAWASADNTPAFEAYLAAAQTVSDAAQTKVTINTEVYDSDSCYDHTTNYRFTPTTAGKYFCYGTVTSLSSSNSDLNEAMASFQFNGSRIATSSSTFDDNEINMSSSSIYRVITFNGSSDYLELYGRTNINSGTAYFSPSHEKSTMFGAYRIIGV